MNIKKLLLIILFTFLIGGLFSFLTFNNEWYNLLIKPPLTPSMILFPIVWSIIYLLISISLYIVSKDDNKYYRIYIFQLIVNSIWTLLFFGLKLKLFSFVWLLLLIIFIIIMLIKYYRENKTAGYLVIPYLLWAFFAAYLNLGIYILNR